MEIAIKLATNKDEKAIDVFDEFRDNKPLEISRQEVWVAEVSAEDENEIAGYATFNYFFYRKPFIKYLNIHPKFERQGVADALVKFIEEKCQG
jgi:GNAT superfamily N-acetyltransferase